MRLFKKTSKSKKFAECDLSLPVRTFLNREGYDRIIRELPFFDRSIDVYGVAWADEAKTTAAAKTIAVELKLTKVAEGSAPSCALPTMFRLLLCCDAEEGCTDARRA